MEYRSVLQFVDDKWILVCLLLLHLMCLHCLLRVLLREEGNPTLTKTIY